MDIELAISLPLAAESPGFLGESEDKDAQQVHSVLSILFKTQETCVFFICHLEELVVHSPG